MGKLRRMPSGCWRMRPLAQCPAYAAHCGLFLHRRRQAWPAAGKVFPVPQEIRSDHFLVTVNGIPAPVSHAAANSYYLNFDMTDLENGVKGWVKGRKFSAAHGNGICWDAIKWWDNLPHHETATGWVAMARRLAEARLCR